MSSRNRAKPSRRSGILSQTWSSSVSRSLCTYDQKSCLNIHVMSGTTERALSSQLEAAMKKFAEASSEIEQRLSEGRELESGIRDSRLDTNQELHIQLLHRNRKQVPQGPSVSSMAVVHLWVRWLTSLLRQRSLSTWPVSRSKGYRRSFHQVETSNCSGL